MHHPARGTAILLVLFLAVSVSAAAEESVGVIVEFRDPPRVLVRSDAATETMARFRRDLDAIVNARSARKTQAQAPTIAREYRNLVAGAALTVPSRSIAEIRRLPYVKAVYRDAPVRFFDLPAKPHADEPRSAAVTTIGADKLWAMGSRGQGIVVAVIDSGIEYTLPELGGRLGTGCRVIGGYDFENDDADPTDAEQHGTAVASIMGGSSDRYTGVAPEVSFLAYRTLYNAHVLAAMEHAVDPNGDGDFSDRADVVNLSIGIAGNMPDTIVGNPTDIFSRAVDNASRAGMVVVAAVGNEERGHWISGYALARTAIAVGLGETTGVHGSSGRGPGAQELAIKPEVISPGMPVWAVQRRGLIEFGGTSAATPHVAGAAALLLVLHPDWTPERVKYALMNTAATLPNDDVLSQGSGMIAVDRATAADVTLDPPALSLGLYPLEQSAWTQTRTIRVTNRGNAVATFDVTAPDIAGATVTVAPASLSLPAGAATDVTVTMTITAAATPAPLTFGVGGYVQFTSTSAHPSLHVPWAAVKAARVTVVSDRPIWTVRWIDEHGNQIEPWLLSAFNNELLIAPGQYDFYGWGEDEVIPGTARLVYRPQERVEGDRTMTVSAAAAHTLVLDGRDEHGQAPPLSAVAGRLVRPEGNEPRVLILPSISARTIEVDPLPAGFTLLLHESWYDRVAKKLYAMTYGPLAGVQADATLPAGGAELARVDATIYSTAVQRQHLLLEVSSVLREPGPHDTFGSETSLPIARFFQLGGDAERATMSVFMSPDPHPGYRSIVQLSALTTRETIRVPALRVIDGRIVAGPGSPALYSGDHLVVGRGVAFPRVRFNLQPALSKLVAHTNSVGAAGETRHTDAISGQTEVNLRTPGLHSFEVISSGGLTPSIPRQSKATFTLDASRGDFIPPVLTSLRLLGSDERLAARLDTGARGSLQFSAADYEYEFLATEYRPFPGEATKLWYRVRGTDGWSPLTLTQLLEDTGTPLRLGEGILYRADVSPIAAAAGQRFVDLKIELADTTGNTATYELESAFSIGPETLPRRRSVRK
ncbi:MAG TPA: S8 family serine peptidase [Thermoanaerobaculia bacterium]|nr:S8 family serine peptidase [Thermoanaerobaculia bacterium]